MLAKACKGAQLGYSGENRYLELDFSDFKFDYRKNNWILRTMKNFK